MHKAGLNVSNTFSGHCLQIKNILKYANMSLLILKIILFVLRRLAFQTLLGDGIPQLIKHIIEPENVKPQRTKGPCFSLRVL